MPTSHSSTRFRAGLHGGEVPMAGVLQVKQAENYDISQSVEISDIRNRRKLMDSRIKEDFERRLSAQRELIAGAENRERAALVQIIRTVSAVAAFRDHYTALHQERVALLCYRVGRRLALASERLEGLYLGALIHDIGKVAIPSEILNKPGRLGDEEMSLVRTHVQAGCDMLRQVIFPWPIQTIVAQHHERLDGSGYPRRLAGAAISPESRIVAVCDVFQALCDDRPYRKALGIRAALDELNRGAGTLFDADAVSSLADIVGRRPRSAPAFWAALVGDLENLPILAQARH